MIRVQLHELEGAREPRPVEEPHQQSAVVDELSQPVRPSRGRAQHVERFGEHGRRGDDWLPNRLQGVHAPRVLPISRIEEGDERPRIDEHHR